MELKRIHTQSRYQADTKSRKESASQKQGNAGRGSLEGNPEVKYQGGDDEGQAAANDVGHEGRCEGTEECASRENRDDCRLLGRRDGGVTFGVDIARAKLLVPVFLRLTVSNRLGAVKL